MGFDDVGFYTLITPPITAVRQPAAELGRMSVRLLLQRIKGDSSPTSVRTVLPVSLVIRESCGCKRRGISNYSLATCAKVCGGSPKPESNKKNIFENIGVFFSNKKATVNAPSLPRIPPQNDHKNTTVYHHNSSKPPAKTPSHHSEKRK